MYYRDPDRNTIEVQVDNFDTPEEANAFMEGRYFRENPIGTDFDPEEFVRKVRAGADEGKLKERVEIGSRGVPDFFI